MPLSSNLDFVALGGHTRPTLPLLLVHIHARYEELLELMGTHMPHRFLDSSNGPYFCVRAEGTSVFESTQGLKWRELSFRLVSFVWPAPVRFVRSSFFVRQL